MRLKGDTMSVKGEFLSSKAQVLMEHLRNRGWTVEGMLTDFTATFKDITMKYRDGDINICFSDGREIVRMKITDIL